MNSGNTKLAPMVSVEMDPAAMNLATINNETVHTDGWASQQWT
jgi:hypothetical protein